MFLVCTDPLELLKADLKEDDIEQVVQSLNRLRLIGSFNFCFLFCFFFVALFEFVLMKVLLRILLLLLLFFKSALALGPERTRKDLIPFLQGQTRIHIDVVYFFFLWLIWTALYLMSLWGVWCFNVCKITLFRLNALITNVIEYTTIDRDEAQAALARQLGEFVELVGGPEHASLLLPVLETQCGLEETLIREAVCLLCLSYGFSLLLFSL